METILQPFKGVYHYIYIYGIYIIHHNRVPMVGTARWLNQRLVNVWESQS